MFYALHAHSQQIYSHVSFKTSFLSADQRDQIYDSELLVIEEGREVPLGLSSKKLPDVLLGLSPGLVISERVKVILEALPERDKLQFVSVKVKKKNYWLLNVRNLVPAFDWKNSKYTTYDSNPNIIRGVELLVFKLEVVEGLNLFRMEEKPIGIYISEHLKNILVEEKITGIRISDISKETNDDYTI